MTSAASRDNCWGKCWGKGFGGQYHGGTAALQASDGAHRRNACNTGRHADGDGLYLTVRPGGSKQWIFLYRSGGRLREMGLGSPASGVTLARARQLAAEARAQMTQRSRPLGSAPAGRAAGGTDPKFGDYALALVDRIEVGFSNSETSPAMAQHADDLLSADLDHAD